MVETTRIMNVITILTLVAGSLIVAETISQDEEIILFTNGSISDNANKTDDANSTVGEGQVMGNDQDTRPESDKGIVENIDLILVILFVFFLAGISISIILFFRRRSYKEVEWEEEEELNDEDPDDDVLLPEEGYVGSGHL